ncbi:MAG: GNAT family N-acetyltransferase [Deltaproteobacteria bacterium]|nr:GNAT family N-acetyltransferase [Deltaproteobacteria bacterium]
MESQPNLVTRLAVAADGARIGRVLDALRAEFGYTAQATVPLPVDANGPLYVVLAELDDEPAGLIAAEHCYSLVRGTSFLLLSDIYVLDGYRRRGVAARMIHEVAALGRRLGCQRVSLILDHINNAALATVSRAGFTKLHDILLQLPLREERGADDL